MHHLNNEDEVQAADSEDVTTSLELSDEERGQSDEEEDVEEVDFFTPEVRALTERAVYAYILEHVLRPSMILKCAVMLVLDLAEAARMPHDRHPGLAVSHQEALPPRVHVIRLLVLLGAHGRHPLEPEQPHHHNLRDG